MASIRDLGFLRRSATLRRLYRGYRWRFRFRPRIQRAIRELEAAGDPAAQGLARALRGALDGGPPGDARGWIDRIEGLRGRLLESEEEIAAVDFGTGSAETERTAEEMSRGTPVVYSVRDLCLSSSNPPQWDRVLFQIVRELKPRRCVEMGTCLGLSAAYQGAALELNGDGELVTLEGAPTLAKRSQAHLRSLGVERVQVRVGRFEDTLEPTTREMQPVDYAFVDGHHDGRATIEYFTEILPHLADAAVVVFDDIHYNDDMRRAWDEIARHDRVRHAADLGSMGVTLVAGGAPA